MSTLTRKQLFVALQKNPGYLAMRWYDGSVVGANSKIVLKGSSRYPINDTATNIQSFYPISFHEYIRIKVRIL